MGPYRVGHNDQCRHAEILSGSSRDTGRVVELAPLNEGPNVFISRSGDYGEHGATLKIDRTDYVRADFKPF